MSREGGNPSARLVAAVGGAPDDIGALMLAGIGAAARLPLASIVTYCSGPDCAAMAASEAMPGAVRGLVVLPKMI